jgi:hypothetical protein
MMADHAPKTISCGDVVRALMAGRWDDWEGLPADCSLAVIASEMGGSEMLDAAVDLGRTGVACARSRLRSAPILVWHEGDAPLLVECDLLGDPRQPPPLDVPGIHRLNVHWGAASATGGEAVMAERGLAVILTGEDRVVACRGFAPMTFDDYVATRRPASEPLRPFEPIMSEGHPQ